MDRQLDRLAEIEPDVLLVLDAARWDTWNDEYDHGEPVRSPASCTKDWVGAFIDRFGTDATCVTASPIQRRHYPDAFDRVDVWEREWRQFNGIPTVSPKDTTEAALKHTDADLLYVHYIQPHSPYPWSDPPLPLMPANPKARDVNVDDPRVPDQFEPNPMQLFNDPDHWLTRDILVDAYKKNLAWVYDALLPFRRVDATVVVTSDHGEFLADGPGDGRYGHPCGSDNPLLREVPLWRM